MTVSAVIPTLGNRPSLLVAAYSAAAQLGVGSVFVVVNGSRWNSELIESLQSIGRVTVLFEKHPGLARARQVGIEASGDEWIAFLDDDDVWLPGKISTQMEHVDDAHVVMCRAAWLLGRGRIRVLPSARPRANELLSDYMTRIGPGPRFGLASPPSMCVRRSFLQECPWWTGDEADVAPEDIAWVARSSRQLGTRWRLIGDVLVVVNRQTPDSMSMEASVAVTEDRRREILAERERWISELASHLGRDSLRRYYLANVLPYVDRVNGKMLGMSLREPWPALIGLRRRYVLAGRRFGPRSWQWAAAERGDAE